MTPLQSPGIEEEAGLSPSPPGARQPRSRPTRKRPVVSVCIANWNCRAHLRACLRSLQPDQQRLLVEVVVVDNGSSDGAAEMVARRFPDVVLVRNARNEGFARANNRAASLARGRYLLFLNNDTVVPPGALRQLVRFARKHPQAGLIGPLLRDPRGRAQLSCRGKPTVAAMLHRVSFLRWTGLFRTAYRRYRGRDQGEGTRRVEVLMGAALLMPRRVFEEGGQWDERFLFGGEDIELCLRIGQRYPVLYYPDVEIIHHGRVSTRRHIGYAYPHILAGITRSLRQAGCSRVGLLVYKLAFTLDAPLQCLGHAWQYGWRLLRGQPEAADKSLLMLRGLGAFLGRGLLSFWRA
jgi:N-acetylglucosaminyl-diphospho-decaprenol L-rhamnosyltransferase